VLREDPRGEPIELASRNARLRRPLERVKSQANHLTRSPQPIPFDL
jgi:hypothetical protein